MQKPDNKQSGLVFLYKMMYDVFMFFLKKYKFILIFILSFGLLGVFYAKIKTINYSCTVSFVIDEGKQGGLSTSISSVLASQLGLDLGGTTGIFLGDNILEFMRSPSISKRVLLYKPPEDSVVLGARYCISTKLDKALAKKYKKSINEIHDLNQLPKLMRDSILRVINEGLFKRYVIVDRVDKKMSFVKIKCTFKDEFFCKTYTDKLVEEVSKYYVEVKTNRTKAIVDKIQSRADSVYNLLNKQSYSSLDKQSKTIDVNPFYVDNFVQAEVTSRDKLALGTMYQEIIKNLEVAKLNLVQSSPSIQVVDTPDFPLKNNKLSWLVALILGGFLGGVVGCLILFVALYIEKKIIPQNKIIEVAS